MDDDHDHHHNYDSSKNILFAFFLNFGFAIIELFGGLYTNSVAILSDSLHDLGDSISLLSSYYLEKYSKKKANSKFTFGHRRFSILSSIINMIFLMIGSIFVLKEAIERLFSPEEVMSEGIILLAIFALAINSWAAYKILKSGKGINQKTIFLHLLEDVLGWFAVLIMGIVVYFKPWYILDPILSILVSLIVLRGIYKRGKEVLAIILQEFPREIDLEKILKELKQDERIKDIHFVQGWTMDGQEHILNFHVVVSDNLTMKEVDTIKKNLKKILSQKGIEFSSLEFEGENCACT